MKLVIKALFLLFWKFVQIVVVNSLAGALFFLPVAALVGFFGWLGGAQDPRGLALEWGAVLGVLFAIVMTLHDLFRMLAAILDAAHQERIRRAMDDSV